jgi:hypothetical protein
MYQIRVKNYAVNNKKYIKEMDRIVHTEEEACKVYSHTIEALVNLDVMVCLFDMNRAKPMKTQHCQVLG